MHLLENVFSGFCLSSTTFPWNANINIIHIQTVTSCDWRLTTNDNRLAPLQSLHLTICLVSYVGAYDSTAHGKGSTLQKTITNSECVRTNCKDVRRQDTNRLATVVLYRLRGIEAWHVSVGVHGKQDVGNISLRGNGRGRQGHNYERGRQGHKVSGAYTCIATGPELVWRQDRHSQNGWQFVFKLYLDGALVLWFGVCPKLRFAKRPFQYPFPCQDFERELCIASISYWDMDSYTYWDRLDWWAVPGLNGLVLPGMCNELTYICPFL